MSKAVLTIKQTAAVEEAARVMGEEHVGSLVVTDENDEPIGIFTERDLLSKVVAGERQPWETPVSEAMSSPIATIDPDVDITEAILMMAQMGIKRLPVAEKGKLVGIITASDIVDALAESEAQVPVSPRPEKPREEVYHCKDCGKKLPASEEGKTWNRCSFCGEPICRADTHYIAVTSEELFGDSVKILRACREDYSRR
jgi:CBS domain-containing protein